MSARRPSGPGASVRHVAAAGLAAGLVHGSLVFGAAVSLLHVVHDRVVSVWNAAVLFLASGLLYGLASAAAFVAAAGAVTLLRRAARRPASPEAGVLAGAFAFDLAFGFFAAGYGLTYDEIPSGGSAGPWTMLAWLGARTLAVAALAALAAWAYLRIWQGVVRRPGGRRALAAAYGVAFAAHVALAAAWAPVPPPPGSAADLPDPATLRAPRKVVFLAADGADWRVIAPMIEAGELPHLARLVESGAHGPLETLSGANSAVLWASIYSGLAPADHGVLDFYSVRLAGMTAGVYPVHRTGFKELAGYLERVGLARRETADRSSLRAPLVWEVAAALGRSIGVVDGYYFSYPAPPLPGPDSYFLAYGTDRFYDRVSRGRRPPSTARGAEDYVRPPALLDELGETLDGWEFEWQSAALLRLLESRPQPDLVGFYSHQPDAVQHWHWRAYEPSRYLGVTPAEVAEHGDEIPAFHRQLDRFLGALLERVEPGTVVILASDHGHSPTLFHAMDTQHRHGPPGILVMAGGPVRRGARLEDAHIYDLYPTLLHLLGLPVPESADGRVLEEAFERDFRAAEPVRTVPSYQALLPAFLPTGERDQGEDARRREELEKLKALGYVR